MDFKQYKVLEEQYLEVEKHLFKSKETFKEFLITVVDDDELLEAYNINRAELKVFVKDIDIQAGKNITNKNILVEHNIGNDYEVLGYNLKPNQSYSAHERAAIKYIQSNSKVLQGNVKKVVLGGLLEINPNVRLYLFLNNN